METDSTDTTLTKALVLAEAGYWAEAAKLFQTLDVRLRGGAALPEVWRPAVQAEVAKVRAELAQDVTAAYYDGQVAGMEAMGL